MIEQLLTSKEVADKLQIKETTVREWARIGILKAIRVGRYWRFRSNDLDNWLKGRERPEKKRFSLEGMIENGQVDEKALDEVTKIWESRELQ